MPVADERGHYVERKPDGTVVNEHTLSYDANGQRVRDVARTMNAENHSAYLEHTHAYEFDPQSRLREVVKSDPAGAVLETESYVHDANGNVIEQVLEGKTTTYDYDRNRLLSSMSDGVRATNSYDPYGRLDKVTARGQVLEKYRYDGFDRIAEQQKLWEGSTDRVTITFAYDPLDRTTTRVEDGDTTDYTYLGLTSDVLTEDVAGTLRKSYQYSPDGKRLSQVTHEEDGSKETAQYGYNPHTDVEVLTDEQGDTKATYGYTAYGQDDEESFTGIDKPDAQQPDKEPYNFYRFNGKRWDSATGTYDMGFRDYNPGLNRFVSRDNYNGALSDLNLGLDPWTGNRYAFAGGNPITGVELDGHGICADDACHYVAGPLSMKKSTWHIRQRRQPGCVKTGQRWHLFHLDAVFGSGWCVPRGVVRTYVVRPNASAFMLPEVGRFAGEAPFDHGQTEEVVRCPRDRHVDEHVGAAPVLVVAVVPPVVYRAVSVVPVRDEPQSLAAPAPAKVPVDDRMSWRRGCQSACPAEQDRAANGRACSQ